MKVGGQEWYPTQTGESGRPHLRGVGAERWVAVRSATEEVKSVPSRMDNTRKGPENAKKTRSTF